MKKIISNDRNDHNEKLFLECVEITTKTEQKELLIGTSTTAIAYVVDCLHQI